MTQTHVQLCNVIYNASTQCFEALASVSSRTGTKKYPCTIEAPITMTFEQAAAGLKTKALRLHAKGKGMSSYMRDHRATLRAGRPKFDPRSWLVQLGFTSLDKAA